MEKRVSQSHELQGEEQQGQAQPFLAEEGKPAQASTLEMSKQIEKVLCEWDATGTNYPREQCLTALFEQQVEATPETIALVSQEQHLTYAELNRRANRLAHFLQVLGVGPEIIVGLCLQRSIEMIIGLLAILKAGGAYLPLDPSSPDDRIAFMLTDARAPLLVTHSLLDTRFATLPAKVICLDQWSDHAPLVAHEDNPGSPVCAEHLAYVIYTSARLALPKACRS